MKFCCLILAFMLGIFIAAGNAEDTRAGQISKKKAEKATHLAHYVPGKAELITQRVEKALTFQPVGLYPFFGSVYTGGLLAAGPGYRKPFNDTGIFDVHGAWSIENYRMVDTWVKVPDLIPSRLSTTLYGRYIHAGGVPFYGLGNDSEKSNSTHFGYNPTSFGAILTGTPSRFIAAGGGIEYLKVDSKGPNRLADVTPGAGTDPLYTVASGFAAFDWRQSPRYTTRGGYYRAEWRDYLQHGDNDPFSFRSFEAEASQFVPILRANQVIALHALTTITYVNGQDIIPYFMMPRLGGSHYLRGFPSGRFRDRHRLLLTAEYRWTPSKFMDVALFYEGGKVAATTSDLNLRDLHRDFGIGFRFHSPSMTMLRIELAHSNEGTRFIFTVGPSF